MTPTGTDPFRHGASPIGHKVISPGIIFSALLILLFVSGIFLPSGSTSETADATSTSKKRVQNSSSAHKSHGVSRPLTICPA